MVCHCLEGRERSDNASSGIEKDEISAHGLRWTEKIGRGANLHIERNNGRTSERANNERQSRRCKRALLIA